MPFERKTKQREMIREAFEEAGRPLSIAQLLKRVQRSGAAASVATVYRTVRTLVEEGWLETIDLPGSAPYYEIAGKEHHHHFLCLQCDRAYELPACAAPRAQLPPGFRALSHAMTVLGACAACSKGAARSAGE